MKLHILSVLFVISSGMIMVLNARGVKYAACMRRMGNSQDFSERAKRVISTNMKIETCIKACWRQRRKYAGLQKGADCYCSVGVTGVTKVPESECDKRCNQNCYQACGGETALSVYETGYTREPPFPMKKEAIIQARIGCYDKEISVNILCPTEFTPVTTLRMTPGLCIYYCDSVYQTKFSTTSDTDKCCCSNSVAGARNADFKFCKRKCLGDPDPHGVGCYGRKRTNFYMSTFQISRLPKFKRWPESAFKEAAWLEPMFPPGETFEIKSSLAGIGVADASLAGLLAKSLSRKPDGEDSGFDEDAAAEAPKSLAGGDKRGSIQSSVSESVAVSEVKGKPLEKVPDEGKGNGVIIAAVVVGFVLCVAAFGYYLYSQRKKGEKEDETDEDEGQADEEDEDNDEDDDEKDRKRKRHKKKKKKRRRKQKEREDEEGETDDAGDDEEADLI